MLWLSVQVDERVYVGGVNTKKHRHLKVSRSADGFHFWALPVFQQLNRLYVGRLVIFA